MSGWIPVILVLPSFFLWSCPAQIRSSISVFDNEVARWNVLTYEQSYIDDVDERVVYHGTLFVQLSRVSLESCNLKLGVRVQDKFSGTTTKQHALSLRTTQLGQKTQTYNYTYALRLIDLEGVQATVLNGRPMQIRSGTGYICDENPSCKLTWLDLKLPEALIKETLEVNGFIDFDEEVKEIMIPVSSYQTAQDAESTLRSLIAECQPSVR